MLGPVLSRIPQGRLFQGSPPAQIQVLMVVSSPSSSPTRHSPQILLIISSHLRLLIFLKVFSSPQQLPWWFLGTPQDLKEVSKPPKTPEQNRTAASSSFRVSLPGLRGSQAVSHPSGQKRKHGPNCTEEGLRLGSVAARVLNWELQSPVHCPVACFCQVWWQPLC